MADVWRRGRSPRPRTGLIRRQNGAAAAIAGGFFEAPAMHYAAVLRRWDGSGWRPCKMRRWTGLAWADASLLVMSEVGGFVPVDTGGA